MSLKALHLAIALITILEICYVALFAVFWSAEIFGYRDKISIQKGSGPEAQIASVQPKSTNLDSLFALIAFVCNVIFAIVCLLYVATVGLIVSSIVSSCSSTDNLFDLFKTQSLLRISSLVITAATAFATALGIFSCSKYSSKYSSKQKGSF